MPTGSDVTLPALGAAVDWRNDWVLPGGFVFALETAARADIFAINEDSGFDDLQTRIAPMAAVELSWPLGRLSTPPASTIW